MFNTFSNLMKIDKCNFFATWMVNVVLPQVIPYYSLNIVLWKQPVIPVSLSLQKKPHLLIFLYCNISEIAEVFLLLNPSN